MYTYTSSYPIRPARRHISSSPSYLQGRGGRKSSRVSLELPAGDPPSKKWVSEQFSGTASQCTCSVLQVDRPE